MDVVGARFHNLMRICDLVRFSLVSDLIIKYIMILECDWCFKKAFKLSERLQSQYNKI